MEVKPELRGKGFGSELLKRATDWADNKGVTLVAFLDPKQGGLTKEQEKAWLKRNGFVHCWHDFSNSLVSNMKRGMMREPIYRTVSGETGHKQKYEYQN